MTSLSSTRASSQDVPTNSLGKLHSGAEVHLKCAGAYVTLDSEETYLKWDVTAGAGTSGAVADRVAQIRKEIEATDSDCTGTSQSELLRWVRQLPTNFWSRALCALPAPAHGPKPVTGMIRHDSFEHASIE